MNVVLIILDVLLVVTSLLLVATILLHKGRGGGISDMFGGGLSTSMRSSGVAERNLNRITIGVALVWFVIVVAIGLITKFWAA
ncbi:MAG: preprotein translocase subunit SecG [Actinomycetaceae bacterium]|nr:preprotein translocase subunit SecG [Actinomycetaceae bacterium]